MRGEEKGEGKLSVNNCRVPERRKKERLPQAQKRLSGIGAFPLMISERGEGRKKREVRLMIAKNPVEKKTPRTKRRERKRIFLFSLKGHHEGEKEEERRTRGAYSVRSYDSPQGGGGGGEGGGRELNLPWRKKKKKKEGGEEDVFPTPYFLVFRMFGKGHKGGKKRGGGVEASFSEKRKGEGKSFFPRHRKP